MQRKVDALLVHDEEGAFGQLRPLLEQQDMETWRARTCAEAERALSFFQAPVMVFTDTTLPDGTWAEVRALAARLRLPVPVVVVSRFVDLNLYLNVLESGAADFIVPPFDKSGLAYVVRGAMLATPPSPKYRTEIPPENHLRAGA